MHAGNKYSLKEVLFWTRRDIYVLVLLSTVPTFCFVVLDWKWLAIPWLPIALLGTAVAFEVGFKNNASYDRMWEARKAWGAIVNASRAWGFMVQDFVTNQHAKTKVSPEELRKIQLDLSHRHMAWLTALRFQLREKRNWEAIYKKHNQEYKNKWFTVEEHDSKLEEHLAQYVSAEELKLIMSKTNKAAFILSLQSDKLRELLEAGLIEDFRHMEMEKVLVEFLNQQGASERIKNFPYPRQYATINLYFIKIFIALVPFGMLQEFQKLGDNLVWLSIPFSVLSSWIFTTMEKIGESTESPFEGSANDVPITAISRSIEIDLRELFNETSIPQGKQPQNNILV